MSDLNQHITFIPLNKLKPGNQNVRKHDRKADIDALAASIAAHGLLQNLNVVEAADGRYDVVAGARRLAALKQLAAAGKIARDFATPCHIMAAESAGEASLAENIQRVAMDAMDEVEAFAALAAQGLSNEDIARRFGCALRNVEQRLALARLSPKLKAAYRRKDLSLDAARAFCLTDDHGQQEAVFKALGRCVMHAHSVRAHLMKGAMRLNDRIVRFVGLKAYEAEGGTLTRDLFEETEAFINDPALMTRLAGQRLEEARQKLLADGWGWVEINLAANFPHSGSGERLYPSRRPMNADENAAVEALEAEEAALQEALDEAEEDDERWSRLDDLEARRHALFEALQIWDEALKPLAGAIITLDHDGRPNIALGHVAKEDAARFRRLKQGLQASNADEEMQASEGRAGLLPPWEAPAGNLPKSLVLDLSRARSRALSAEITLAPDIALAVAVFALSAGVRGQSGAPGIALDLRGRERESLMHAERANMPGEDLPALMWCLACPREALLSLLAGLVASAIDLAHEGASIEDARKHAVADKLAEVLDLDMRRYWSVDAAFLARLSKTALIDILADTAPDEGQEAAAAGPRTHAKMSKAELVALAGSALSDTGWLPDMLVTPIASGALVLTEDGANCIAAA